MTQVINWSDESGDGVYIGGRDPTALINPTRPMTYKFFRPTVLNIKNVRKDPVFKNTVSTGYAARVDKFQDRFDVNNVEGRTSKFDLGRGYSALKELGKDTNAVSILAEVRGSKVSGMDSILERNGFSKSDQYSSKACEIRWQPVKEWPLKNEIMTVQSALEIKIANLLLMIIRPLIIR